MAAPATVVHAAPHVIYLVFRVRIPTVASMISRSVVFEPIGGEATLERTWRQARRSVVVIATCCVFVPVPPAGFSCANDAVFIVYA